MDRGENFSEEWGEICVPLASAIQGSLGAWTAIFVFRPSDIASGAFLETEGVSVRVRVIKYCGMNVLAITVLYKNVAATIYLSLKCLLGATLRLVKMISLHFLLIQSTMC